MSILSAVDSTRPSRPRNRPHRARSRGRLALALVTAAALLGAGPATAVCLDPPGDVDGSGTTNVVDTQCTLITALWQLAGSSGPPPTCVPGADISRADPNCDGVINVSDVQIIITYALGVALSPALDSNGDGCPDACGVPSECGDGVCDADEDCASCPQDCGPCAGSCCEADPLAQAPGCDDATCEACVCGFDSFCCEDAYDELCEVLAGTFCLGVCGCPPAGELSCSGAVTCAVICEGDAGCIDACRTAGAPAAAALVACGEANACLVASDVDACLNAACGDEVFVCFGGVLPESCCDAGPGGGCDDPVCEGCVCGLDDFCCDVQWDGFCSQAAAGFCGAACECEGGEGDCIEVTNCLIGCATTACVDTCLSQGQPGTAGPANALAGCLDAAGCLLIGDQEEFELCATTECGGPLAVCGDFESPFPLGCCDVQPTPNCGDATCEACVCGLDEFCCDTSWDALCRIAAADDCAGECGCAPGVAGCVPVVNCVLSCTSSFCVDQCRGLADPGSLGAADALVACLDTAGCLDLEDPTDFGACLDANCGAELAVCQAAGPVSCCDASDLPGCADAGCEACVCDLDAFCCESIWDGLCAAAAASPACSLECGCVPPPGDCCAPSGGEGCTDVACEACVCAEDEFCCEVTWDEICAAIAADDCDGVCECTTPPGDCCSPSGGAGCLDAVCEACVCAEDEFCCAVSWDGVCAGLATGLCDASCGCELLPADCCAPGELPGCDDATCEACVCDADPFCCETIWDSFCVGAAADPDTCGLECGCEPPAPNCCAESSEPGCVLPACEACVCAEDPFCCDSAWDLLCVSVAADACGAECGCEAPFLGCCTPTEEPGCADPTCEACVCGEDPFCCDTSWDGVCVNEAATTCVGVCGCASPGANCVDTVNCWLTCPDEPCEDACFAAAAPTSAALSVALLACLSDAGCLAATTQEQFLACLQANCDPEASACFAD